MCAVINVRFQIINLLDLTIVDSQYCEYYPEYDKCKQWLERNLPNEFEKMKLGKYKKTPKIFQSNNLFLNDIMFWSITEDGSTEAGGGEDEKKRQKRGGKGMLKTKKKEDIPRLVTVSRAPRGKKKSVTVVTGLSTFGKVSNQCFNWIYVQVNKRNFNEKF